MVPRAFRYGPDYSGLNGVKELRLGQIIQTQADIERNKKSKATGEEKKKKTAAVQSRLEHLGY